ncbi:hypothetical protein [Pseudomonas fluorescens]|uniref:Uncharacterized protein n=1 Tax=Pseudomonas fluorescens TaxID=294 RepID=A0A5E7FUX9_PSEFL|nr:hypothetical protein [Pseudomonas fluorescens]VVO40763.1 hypothetical protein PS833_05803 [Pseudomonas fluorescens]
MQKTAKFRPSQLSIDGRIFIRRRGETEDQHSQRIFAELRKFNLYNASNLIFSMASHKNFPAKFLPVYGASRGHYELSYNSSELSDNNFLAWMLGCFTAKSKLLSDFCKLRNLINSEILNGNSREALVQIQSLNKLCKSWWAIFLEVHIAKELELKDTRQLIQGLPTRFVRADISGQVLDLQLMSESSSVAVFVRDLLGRMNEYRSSGLQNAIDSGALESCRFLPLNLDPDRIVKPESLKALWFESIIDQYVIFKDVICECGTAGLLTDSMRKAVLDLSKKIEDEELQAILGVDQPIAPAVSAVLEDYTRGNYDNAIARIKNLQKLGSNEIFGLVEIYAKSKIYARSIADDNTFFDQIANELAAILQCDNKTAEKLSFLNQICVKFKHEPWAKSLNFHLLSALEEVEDDKEIESARLQASCLGRLNTPKAKIRNYRFPLEVDNAGSVPLHRQIKYSANDDLAAEIEKPLIPVLSDYLKLKSRTLILKEQYIDAINFAVDEYLENSVSCLHLPMRTLCQIAGDIPKTSNEIFISCLIAYDIYNREHSGIFEEDKAELFDDLMKFNGSHRPSHIFQKEKYSRAEIFFLKNLCIPSQLDNLINYTSNDDVVHERVAILDLLIQTRSEGYEQLRYEKDNVLETLFAEKLRAKIESAKLFVDIQALESQRKHVYRSLFEQAKSNKGGINLEPLPSNNDTAGSNDIFEIVQGSALASNRKTQLLYEIFDTAVRDFALNENYGLDKYLSAEIRHIVFTTQLRSCFEKTRLVTSLKDGAYLPNDYWLNKYNFVHISIVEKIDNLLKVFSQRVDLILGEVNECFRVELFDRESPNVFDFLAYHFRLVRVSEIVTRTNNAEDFFTQLLDYMWELASDSAKAAQELINDHLASEILNALTDLERGINYVKGDVAVADLMQEIKNARSIFTKEIEFVLNWFRFVGADDSKNLERLSVVVDATITSFESIYGHKYRKPFYASCRSNLTLNYREARALFICLFTALENACKYGGELGQVSMDFSVGNAETIIAINNLMQSYPGVTAEELILREKAKWSPEHSNLSREEGGSGLYKIYSTLSNSSSGFTFDIKADKTSFTALIGLRHENFDHRRQLTKARENS